MGVELMKRYNVALEKYRKAESWFDDPSVPQAEKEKHEMKLVGIIRECGEACNVLEAAGVKMTPERLQKGFSEVAS